MVRQVELQHIDAGHFQAVGVVGEQHERGQARGTDRITLGYRLGGVAHRIEGIGDVSHLGRQFRHLGDASGVVGDRAEGIQRDDHPGHRQHARRRDGDAVEIREFERAPDRCADRNDRPCGGFHRNAESGDDVGRVTGGRGGRDPSDRLIVAAGVVLGDYDHRGRQRQTDQRREIQIRSALTHQRVGNRIGTQRLRDPRRR